MRNLLFAFHKWRQPYKRIEDMRGGWPNSLYQFCIGFVTITAVSWDIEEWENDILDTFSRVICYATGGMLSKTNYTVDTYIGEIDNYIQSLYEEWEAESTNEEEK